MFMRISYFIVLLAATMLAGCASPARIDQMTASRTTFGTASIDPKLKSEISVREVTGGRETSPMWTSQVGSAEFRRALENSLQAHGLLGVSGRYQLTADLVRLDQPIMGFDMSVTATVRYFLVDRVNRQELFSKTLPTTFTASVSDAFVGTERLRMANEGAVRKNIEALINDISALKVQVSLN